MTIGIKISETVVSLLVFVCFLRFRESGEEEKVLRAYRELQGFLRKRSTDGGIYQRLQEWLVRNGADFHFGEWVNPARYALLCLLSGLIGYLVLRLFGAAYGPVGLVLFGGLPVALTLYMNNADNEKFLPELKLVYHALEVQIKAGVYVIDALAECYGSVREKRLKKALLDLSGNIVMKADIHDSLEQFRNKFDNRYIDALCITILQALESGQAVELLRDLSEQVKDMEESVLEKKKGALDRSLTICQLLVLTVVLGLALYACVTYMFSAVKYF